MFQKKVIDFYLSQLDNPILLEKYNLYSQIFLDKSKQDNIRNSKEEQYQEGFLRDLFVSVLGYTIKPEHNFNLFTEAKNDVKNKSNSKKADGAICEENNENNVKAVIELKSTATKDLDLVAFQAFSYKNFHSDCKYIIVSNFEKLRFYVEVQSDFEEFDLFRLSFERFCILYALLEVNQIKNDVALKIKNESLSEEKQITNEFYRVYSTFKHELFKDICENNPDFDKLTLFKKTQKLLDRILFIRFCSDRGLLPSNSVLNIIKRWQNAKENFLEVSLYSLFRQFFNWIDTGFDNPKDKSGSIFAYNGGLFKSDEVLDNIKIGDDVLYIHCNKLGQYNFESQISVDILGRIFENSLTEIEEVEAGISNEQLAIRNEEGEVSPSLQPPTAFSATPSAGTPRNAPSNIGKRKKDGVFYTPEYITRYIVENTIGKLCAAKKEELKINDEEFSLRTKTTSARIAELDSRLESYRAWLLQLKILDPACGSGAFLNATLQALRKEHILIDSLWSKIHKGELNFSQIDNSILENNLYGVDINEDSIEITKLSLWLNTAKKNRKLTTLNGKIKCGNSLISDKSVAGEKAFVWEEEFPEVWKIENGKWKVENGEVARHSEGAEATEESNCHADLRNPTDSQLLRNSFKDDEKSQDRVSVGNSNPRGNTGGFDVIIGNPPYVSVNNIKNLKDKEFYKSHYKTAKEMYDLYSLFTEKAASLLKPNGLFGFIFSNSWLGIKSFESFREFLAKDVTVTCLVQLPEKVFADATVKTIICLYTNKKPLETDEIALEKCEDGIFSSKGFSLPYSKLLNTHGYNFTLDKTIELNKIQTVKLGDIMKASCGIKSANDKKFILREIIDDDCYPILRGRNLRRWAKPENTENEYIWYKPELMTENVNARPRDLAFFTVPQKILIQEIAQEINATLETEQNLCNDTLNIIYELKNGYDMKFILCLLNSELINFWFKQTYPSGLHVKVNQLETIPIPSIENPQFSVFNSQLSVLSDQMLSLTADLQKLTTRFLGRIKETYGITKITQNLESFYNLSFADFAKELSKQKVKLSLKQKDELEDYFGDYVKEISALNEQITSTDAQINSLVYALYGLTDEEIATFDKKQRLEILAGLPPRHNGGGRD